jgi:ribonuclease HI
VQPSRRKGCTSLGWPEWPQLSRSPARLSAQDAHDLVRHEVWQDGQWQPAERGSLARTVWQAGEIYADGSSFHTGGVLAHAGWGIVRVCEGAPAERVFGPLPGALSQTEPNAEFAALSVAAQLADPSIGMTIRQDCKAAVDIWNRIAQSGSARGTLLRGQQYVGRLRLAIAAHPSTRTSAPSATCLGAAADPLSRPRGEGVRSPPAAQEAGAPAAPPNVEAEAQNKGAAKASEVDQERTVPPLAEGPDKLAPQ